MFTLTCACTRKTSGEWYALPKISVLCVSFKTLLAMLEKLHNLKKRYQEIEAALSQPDAMEDLKRFRELSKSYKELSRIVERGDQYEESLSNLEEAKTLLREEKDEEMREMAKLEIEEQEERIEKLTAEIKELLIPKDPNDDKNAILEIRAGAGGDEAALFAGDLYRMYQRFAENAGWKTELMNFNEGTSGGYKEIVLSVHGEDVYANLKFESGVHRVQRVPSTESQGRVHTSAASVVVLPEMDDVEVELNMGDVRKDTFRASGAGGQHVNKTESAVRLTHEPTGIVVECQDERSQLKNYDRALKVLRAKLYDMEQQKQNAEVAAARKGMVRSGDRSEKIRTYNYPQGRVTDHRINFSVYNLPAVMDGGLTDFVEQLRIADNAARMAAATESEEE